MGHSYHKGASRSSDTPMDAYGEHKLRQTHMHFLQRLLSSRSLIPYLQNLLRWKPCLFLGFDAAPALTKVSCVGRSSVAAICSRLVLCWGDDPGLREAGRISKRQGYRPLLIACCSFSCRAFFVHILCVFCKGLSCNRSLSL